ncbi:MAG: flagellar hook-basal body complex protein FliE [Pseudomonadota bacterium]
MSGPAPIDAIAADILGDLPPSAFGAAPPVANPAAANALGGFGELFSQGLAQVNENLLAGQADLQRLATGDIQNLHQVMVRLEESRLSFQLALQVRNRLLEAYQDVMKMQI